MNFWEWFWLIYFCGIIPMFMVFYYLALRKVAQVAHNNRYYDADTGQYVDPPQGTWRNPNWYLLDVADYGFSALFCAIGALLWPLTVTLGTPWVIVVLIVQKHVVKSKGSER